MPYIIVDALRLDDFMRMDTTAQTEAEARLAAEEMAKRFGCPVTVLAPVAVCEGAVEPRWTKEFPQAPFGWVGG